jgi:hypothetical protein
VEATHTDCLTAPAIRLANPSDINTGGSTSDFDVGDEVPEREILSMTTVKGVTVMNRIDSRRAPLAAIRAQPSALVPAVADVSLVVDPSTAPYPCDQRHSVKRLHSTADKDSR